MIEFSKPYFDIESIIEYCVSLPGLYFILNVVFDYKIGEHRICVAKHIIFPQQVFLATPLGINPLSIFSSDSYLYIGSILVLCIGCNYPYSTGSFIHFINPFADGSIIKFGKGFEGLQLSVSGPEFTIVPPTEIADQKPVLEFTLGCGSQTAPIDPKPSVLSRIESQEPISADKKLKSVVVVDDSVPFSAPSQFEMGSSSNPSEIMTKTQRRNKNRRVKRRMEKLGLSSKSEPIPPTSPHLSGSRFHLLSVADGEEDVRMIARSVPTAVRKSTPEPVKNKETHIQNMVKAIVQECADNHFQTVFEKHEKDDQ